MSAAKEKAIKDTVEIIKAHGANPNFNFSQIGKNLKETYEALVKLYKDADSD
ncbi:hypothetical protein ACFL43_02040 [Thermodesulfobacteriota bacterium]